MVEKKKTKKVRALLRELFFFYRVLKWREQERPSVHEQGVHCWPELRHSFYENVRRGRKNYRPFCQSKSEREEG